MRNVFVLIGLLLCVHLFSQRNASKNDIVFTKGGQLLQVKVTKVADDMINFNYPGEAVVNEISTNKIEKIVFASGRTQNFGGAANTNKRNSNLDGAQVGRDDIDLLMEETTLEPTYEENKIAIVPVDFKRNGKYDRTLSNKGTEYIVNLFTGKTVKQGIGVLEMRKIIEKLVDSGYNYGKLRESSPEQIREALRTEYLLYVTINEETSTNNMEESDFGVNSPKKNAKLERTINIRLYGADSEAASFEMDLAENMLLNKPADSSNLLTSGKWKSSLRYLTDQLLTANVFPN